MEEVKIKEFLDLSDGSGSGSGSGFGSGTGVGYGSGSGSGSGTGVGYGSGSGFGSGTGVGYGSGSGSGSGTGVGYGSGYGYGSGSGSGYGIEEINGEKVYQIDGVPTILRSIHDNVAKGVILRNDMTFAPCFVVKGGGYFAHGDTLRQAMDALADKILDGAPEEERITAFVKAHPEYRKPYSNEDLFRWHHNLTGSCEMGRKAFIEDRGLSLDGETTVEQFVELTKNAYNGSVIRKLPAEYGEETYV